MRSVASVRRNLSLSALNVTLYGLRHCGVPNDTLRSFRTIPAAQLRGRWAQQKSLLRHQQASRAQAESSKLSPTQVEIALRIETNIHKLFQSLRVARELLDK